MKTFREFISICEETKKTLKDILGSGVPSERPTSTTTLSSLRKRNTSDLAKPRGSNAGVTTTPLHKSTYRGRVEAGRNPEGRNSKFSDNPDYTGPLAPSAGSGTRDRMPGSTPSSNALLQPLPPSRPTPTTGKNPTSKVKPKVKNYSNFT